jgi:hypothetical protein
VWLSEGAWEVAESEVNMVLQTHQEASSSQRLAQAPDNGADGGGGGSDAAHLGTALNGGGVKHEGNADSAGSTAGVRAEGTSTSTGPAAGGRHISDKLEVAVAGLGPFKLKVWCGREKETGRCVDEIHHSPVLPIGATRVMPTG